MYQDRGVNYSENCVSRQYKESFNEETKECKPQCSVCNKEVLKNGYSTINKAILCNECDDRSRIWAANQAYKKELFLAIMSESIEKVLAKDPKTTPETLKYLKENDFLTKEEETVLFGDSNSPKPKEVINYKENTSQEESTKVHYYMYNCLNENNGKHITGNIDKITCKECKRTYETLQKGREEDLQQRNGYLEHWHLGKPLGVPTEVCNHVTCPNCLELIKQNQIKCNLLKNKPEKSEPIHFPIHYNPTPHNPPLCNPNNQIFYSTSILNEVTCEKCLKLHQTEDYQKIIDSNPNIKQNEMINYQDSSTSKINFREFL